VAVRSLITYANMISMGAYYLNVYVLLLHASYGWYGCGGDVLKGSIHCDGALLFTGSSFVCKMTGEVAKSRGCDGVLSCVENDCDCKSDSKRGNTNPKAAS